MSVAAARQELTRVAGTQLDPAVVRAFLIISIGRLGRTVGIGAWIGQIPNIGRLWSALGGIGTWAGTGALSAITATVLTVGGFGPPAPGPGGLGIPGQPFSSPGFTFSSPPPAATGLSTAAAGIAHHPTAAATPPPGATSRATPRPTPVSTPKPTSIPRQSNCPTCVNTSPSCLSYCSNPSLPHCTTYCQGDNNPQCLNFCYGANNPQCDHDCAGPNNGKCQVNCSSTSALVAALALWVAPPIPLAGSGASTTAWLQDLARPAEARPGAVALL